MEKCINWPCQLLKDHNGPCSSYNPHEAPLESDEVRSAQIEAYWKEKQGDDYGSY